MNNECTEHLGHGQRQQWSANMSVSAADHPVDKFDLGNKATLWDEPRAAGAAPPHLVSIAGTVQAVCRHACCKHRVRAEQDRCADDMQ